MTLGKGAMQTISTKQKINTKSSTDVELVGADDVWSYILRTKWFLEEQGYGMKNNTLYQDNTSTMFLEKYGKESSSQRTRYINTKYFFITDCIKREELDVEYCPMSDKSSYYSLNYFWLLGLFYKYFGTQPERCKKQP